MDKMDSECGVQRLEYQVMSNLYTPPDPQDITVGRVIEQQEIKDVDGNVVPAYITEKLHRAERLAETVVEQGRQINLLQRRVENLETKQLAKLDRKTEQTSTPASRHDYTVCGMPLVSVYRHQKAGAILLAAYEDGALANRPVNPQTADPGTSTYQLGCSKTGELFGWNETVDLVETPKFFVNSIGPTRAT